MEDVDNYEVECSIEELVQLVQDGQELHDPVEVDPLIDDSNDVEPMVVKLSVAQNHAKDVLNFMASHSFQILNTMKFLGMEKKHDKLIRIGVAHLTSMSTKQCDIRTSLSLVRGLHLISMTLHDVLSLLFKLLNLILPLKNIGLSSWLFSFEIVIFICFFYLFL